MMCSAQRIGGSAGNNKNDSELHKTDWAEKARHWAIVKLRIPRFRLAWPDQGCDENAISHWGVVRLHSMQVIHSMIFVMSLSLA